MSAGSPAAGAVVGRPAPAALAAFLRGVERRGAVLAELQCGDADAGDAALARAMRRFRGEAGALAMGAWPRRFWALLLADPALRRHHAVVLELDATDRLAELGSGPRAALLLRLAAGLEDADAAAVLGIAEPGYRLALQRALPHHRDGRADPQAWRRLGEQVHRRIKTLPPPRLVRLSRAREAALAGASDPVDAASPAPGFVRSRPRWLLPLLWTLLVLCAAAFAATFWWRTAALLDGPGPGQAWQRELPVADPASRYGLDAALVSHRDFELLADPQALAAAEQLGFHSWLAAQGGTPLAGTAVEPDRRPRAGRATAARAAGEDASQAISETAHEPR